MNTALTVAAPPPRERFLALARAMVRWALVHPERWTLLYGTPVRGYDAPAESTTGAGTRVAGRVLEIAAEAGPGPLPLAGTELPSDVDDLLTATLAEFDTEASPDAAMRAITAWSSLIGVISAHVFGQLGAQAVALGEQVLEVQCCCLADLVAPR